MMKVIYLAGGCFWGVQDYMMKLNGVTDTVSGYANSIVANPNYKQVKTQATNASETVKVSYNSSIISLSTILEELFNIMDPTQLNFQDIDYGTQYRNGIYYEDENDQATIQDVVREQQQNFSNKIVTEVMKLQNFYPAEDYHQKYFMKNNIENTCHIKKIKQK